MAQDFSMPRTQPSSQLPDLAEGDRPTLTDEFAGVG